MKKKSICIIVMMLLFVGCMISAVADNEKNNFGMSVEEFIDAFKKASDDDYEIKLEDGEYNVYWLGFMEMGAKFSFETDKEKLITSVNFSGNDMQENGSNQVYACLYAFSALNPEFSSSTLIREFKSACGTGKPNTVDGVTYYYLESRTLNTLLFTMECN